MKMNAIDKCNLCATDIDTGAAVYRAPDTQRDLTVYVCPVCGLVQSLPRNDRVAVRTLSTSGGANWGNVRYGKGFRAQYALDKIDAAVPKGVRNRILDVGANRGAFLNIYLAKHSAEAIWAIEPDTRVVSDYSENQAIKFVGQRIEDVKLPANYFDLVHCSHTLEHVCDALAVLNQIRNSMAAHGVMYLEVPSIDFIARDDVVEEFFIDKHLYHFSHETLSCLASKAGFEIIDEWSDTENIGLLVRPAPKKERKCDLRREAMQSKERISVYANSLRRSKERFGIAARKIEKLSSQGIVIWGAGRIFDLLVREGSFDVQVIRGVVDSELPKYVESMHGVKVRFPTALTELEPAVVVICSRTYFDEIALNVRKLCVRETKVISVFDLME